MAEVFIGLSVLATLRDPHNAKVRGLVTNAVAGEMTLNKVVWLANGSRTESLLVPGSNVLEIEVEPDLVQTIPSEEVTPQKPFVDPAILSYAKPDYDSGQSPRGYQTHSSRQYSEPITPSTLHRPSVQSVPQGSVAPSSVDASTTAQSPKAGPSPSSPTAQQSTSAATLTGPFNDIALNGHGYLTSDLDNHDPHAKKDLEPSSRNQMTTGQTHRTRGKRGGKTRLREGMVSTPTQTPAGLGFTSTPISSQQRRSNNRKGWRQTPLLEEPAMANIRLPRDQQGLTSPEQVRIAAQVAGRRRPNHEPMKGKNRPQKEDDDQNGWATGEVTDIQDMGDFNFEENHKKFDKRKVFDEIRRDDTTADEARLVSFNRLSTARLGTAGGKNLHYTENVLDPPIKRGLDHSSSDSDVELNSRSLSRTSTRRKAPSRKGSAMAKTSFDRIASPKVKTDSSTSHRKTSLGQPKAALLISASKRTCPCISPLQMLELEQLAITELGLTEDMMTENAARSIAQTAYGLASGDDLSQGASALVVILAGNNKTGSRAIAAGRHLRNHGARVVLCILGLEREDSLIDSVRRQLKIFRNGGGQAIKQDALMRTLRKLQSPTDLIIDALLGIHVNFDDLRSDDQAAYFQLVCWANGSDADTLALDIPSGIDASTGISTLHDSTPLFITAHHIFSLGAPKTGLLAFLADTQPEKRPHLAVADIGIGPVAWKKFGTRRRHGVEFGGKWVVGVEVKDGVGGDGR